MILKVGETQRIGNKVVNSSPSSRCQTFRNQEGGAEVAVDEEQVGGADQDQEVPGTPQLLPGFYEDQ